MGVRLGILEIEIHNNGHIEEVSQVPDLGIVKQLEAGPDFEIAFHREEYAIDRGNSGSFAKIQGSEYICGCIKREDVFEDVHLEGEDSFQTSYGWQVPVKWLLLPPDTQFHRHKLE